MELFGFMSQDEKMDSDIEAFKEIGECLEEERKAKIRAQFFETVHGELIRLNAIDSLGDGQATLRSGEFVYLNKQDSERLKRVLLGEDE